MAQFDAVFRPNGDALSTSTPNSEFYLKLLHSGKFFATQQKFGDRSAQLLERKYMVAYMSIPLIPSYITRGDEKTFWLYRMICDGVTLLTKWIDEDRRKSNDVEVTEMEKQPSLTRDGHCGKSRKEALKSSDE